MRREEREESGQNVRVAQAGRQRGRAWGRRGRGERGREGRERRGEEKR